MSLPQSTPEVGIALASAVIHAQERLDPGGTPEDETVFRAILTQPDVRAYLEQLDGLALLPVRRS